MCLPAVAALPAAAKLFIGVSTALSAFQQYGQYQSGKAQVRAINEQNEVQAQEIAEAAGVEMTERARAARRERATLRARGAESGINLGSNSFISFLQTSTLNQYNDQGLILRNESNAQRARQANARSLTSQVEIPSALSAALTIGASGLKAFDTVRGPQLAGQRSITG